MHDPHGVRQVGEAGGHPVRAHFCPAKNDDALVVGLFQEGEEEFMFLVGRHGIKRVCDSLGGGAAQTDLNDERIA